MLEVKYIEKGPVFDFKRIDYERHIVARNYFRSGGLYYFRIDEFNYVTIAEEDIIQIVEYEGALSNDSF